MGTDASMLSPDFESIFHGKLMGTVTHVKPSCHPFLLSFVKYIV
jgi:hypothetical protein